MRINQLTILGRLTADPDIKFMQNGTAIANFSIAYNEKWKDRTTGELKEAVHYFDVEAFGTQASYAEKYLVKASRVAIAGSLKQNRWEDNGQPRSRVLIRAERLQGLDRTPTENGNEAAPQTTPQTQAESPPTTTSEAAPQTTPEDDIPF